MPPINPRATLLSPGSTGGFFTRGMKSCAPPCMQALTAAAPKKDVNPEVEQIPAAAAPAVPAAGAFPLTQPALALPTGPVATFKETFAPFTLAGALFSPFNPISGADCCRAMQCMLVTFQPIWLGTCAQTDVQCMESCDVSCMRSGGSSPGLYPFGFY